MKYTIIQISDRAKKQTKINKKYLRELHYVNDIEFIDGNSKDAKLILDGHGIKTDVWDPYEGQKRDPLPGECGYWASMINILNYIVSKKIDMLLVLDDDAELNYSSKNILNNTVSELPAGWDFLSLLYNPDQNHTTSESLIDKKYIHKAINQASATVATVYSYDGAKKILELAQKIGMEYTFDCFIFKHCRLNSLNGYSILPGTDTFAKHDYDFAKSIIDPENKRQNYEVQKA